MRLPGFVAEAALVPSPSHCSPNLPPPAERVIAPAYDENDCYNDCMVAATGSRRARLRFARFCIVACYG